MNISFEVLDFISVSLETFVAPYDFVCDQQNDACELNYEKTKELMRLIEAMPTVCIVRMSSDGLCVSYMSRSEHGSYLFVEIDQVSEDRFLCTALYDKDKTYVMNYMPIDE